MKIRAEQLHKTYQDADRELTVIESLNFEFPAGQSLAIIGRSGIGKSTLLHLLGGLDQPSSGRVFFDQTDIYGLSSDALSEFRGKRIGFIFQFPHLLPEFSALENAAMPLIIAGQSEAQALDEAAKVLGRVGLSERLQHRPGQLSGGEQQRVAIARAVVSKPEVILADEPTGNLDMTTARQIQSLLIEINRELHNILIVVTHSQELADNMDSVLEMLPGGSLEVRRVKA